MDAERLDESQPQQLAALLNVSGDAPTRWSERELADIYRHQLAAPLEFDLAHVADGAAQVVKLRAETEETPLRCFADLLYHRDAPLALLEMTKEFAKGHRGDAASAVPSQISTVLYFAAIAGALVHRGRRITNLDDRGLREGFGWILEQPWVDEPMRALIARAIEGLGPAP